MKQIILTAKQFNAVMKSLKPMVAYDCTRPWLAGVYLEVEGCMARFTALNGYAMTHFALQHSGEKAEKPWSVIMPVTTIKAQPDAPITITVNGDQVIVKNTITEEAIIKKAIWGEYAKYRQTIPETERGICLDAKLLKNVLEGAMLCNQSQIRLAFDAGKQFGPITLRGSDGDLVHYTGLVMPVKPQKERTTHVI